MIGKPEVVLKVQKMVRNTTCNAAKFDLLPILLVDAEFQLSVIWKLPLENAKFELFGSGKRRDLQWFTKKF